MFTAILDTCVLWPSLQRDFLLSLAVEGMYRPTWSAVILEELEYHEIQKLVQRGEVQREAERRAGRLIAQMRTSFDDAEVNGWEPLEGTFGLPDANDEHVVAAAVVAGAGAIVTHNDRDFPAVKVPAHIQVLAPPDFVANTVSIDPIRARSAVNAVVGRSGRRGPRLTEDEVLETLVNRYGMGQAVELIRRIR